MTNIIEIKDLHVATDEKKILNGINLKIETGKVHVIMGPNGSGKSTLANVIMGSPKYTVASGDILFNGESILEQSPDKRAKLGIFLSFQYPQEVPGVTISGFLRTALNSIRGEKNKISILKFKDLANEKAGLLKIERDFLSRHLNQGFSGGEKKRAEILQLLTLDPTVAILDETDSGLDIDALRIVSQGINHFMNKDKAVLIITHYKRILEYIKPDKVSILIDGKIVMEGKGDLVDHLEEKGYGWILEEGKKA